MNCKTFREKLLEYTTADEVDEQFAADMKGHYMSCDACFDHYMQWLEVLDAMNEGTLSGAVGRYVSEDEVEQSDVQVMLNGKIVDLNRIGKDIVVEITKECMVTIKKSAETLFQKVFALRDFRGVAATASKYGEEKPKLVRVLLAEKDGYRIELEKGPSTGKIIITKMDE